MHTLIVIFKAILDIHFLCKLLLHALLIILFYLIHLHLLHFFFYSCQLLFVTRTCRYHIHTHRETHTHKYTQANADDDDRDRKATRYTY